METPLRPLGIVREIVEELGHEITYAYEDLVFMQHNDFLLQFRDAPTEIALYVNTECGDGEADAIEHRLVPAGAAKGLTFIRKGTYTMTEDEGDNLRITFNDMDR
jgi:hypothetical protein